MTVIENLMDEHRHIERMLDCLEAMTAEFQTANRIDATPAREALAFFRGYADRGHHGKEEERLFPALERNGMSPDCGPTTVMRYEHEEGRRRIKQMAEAIDAGERGETDAPAHFSMAARAYIGLLREHIRKEDHCLFPMVDQTLSRKEQEDLQEEFARFEREEMGKERAALVRSLERLERRYQPTGHRQASVAHAKQKSSATGSKGA